MNNYKDHLDEKDYKQFAEDWYEYIPNIKYLYRSNLKRFYMLIVDMDRKEVLELIK